MYSIANFNQTWCATLKQNNLKLKKEDGNLKKTKYDILIFLKQVFLVVNDTIKIKFKIYSSEFPVILDEIFKIVLKNDANC